MTLFYDPVKQKPKLGVLIVLIIIPIIVILIGILTTKTVVENKQVEEQKEVDIFDKF